MEVLTGHSLLSHLLAYSYFSNLLKSSSPSMAISDTLTKPYLGKPSTKNYKTLDIVQKGGGVSSAAELFIKKRYGHVIMYVFVQRKRS